MMEQARELARAGDMDTLYRDDIRSKARPPRRMAKRMRWVVLRGGLDEAGLLASSRLYTRSQAHRFVRLARHLGIDVYCARFGRVQIEIKAGGR